MGPGEDDGLSSEREALKVDFLSRHGLADARREALAGDASTRAYERLHLRAGRTLIFMDQPFNTETAPCPPEASPEERTVMGYNASARLAAGRVEAFVAVAGWLRAQGLSAPEVIAAEPQSGLAVIEDLGDDLFARRIEAGEDPLPLYEAAVDTLVRMQSAPPPTVLQADGASWPLLTYDDLALRTGPGLLLEWWPKFAGTPPITTEAAQAWEALWAPVRARGAAGADVFAHRDYHAENLLWLPDRSGVARVGLLDFQDAVRAHPAWDLLHLLQDARRDVAPDLEVAMLGRYLDARPHLDRAQFLADYRSLAALNAARILFIFARQVAGFGRPRYTAFMPRTWAYLDRNLADPALEGVKAWFDRNLSQRTPT